MIELKVKDYCHNCGCFEPIALSSNIWGAGRCLIRQTDVVCERANICETLHAHIRDEMKQESKDDQQRET